MADFLGWLAGEGDGGTLLLGVLGWLLAVGQFGWSAAQRRAQAAQDERTCREGRFRDERLSAYSDFLSNAWSAYYALESLRHGADEAPIEPGDVSGRLNPLAGPIHLLGPDGLGNQAQQVIADLLLLALLVANDERESAIQSGSARESIMRFEASTRRDLGIIAKQN